MKKNLLFLSAILVATVSFSSCGDNAGTTTETGTVIDTDTVVSEVQVERTVVETDTMVNTETVEVEQQ